MFLVCAKCAVLVVVRSYSFSLCVLFCLCTQSFTVAGIVLGCLFIVDLAFGFDATTQFYIMINVVSFLPWLAMALAFMFAKLLFVLFTSVRILMLLLCYAIIKFIRRVAANMQLSLLFIWRFLCCRNAAELKELESLYSAHHRLQKCEEYSDFVKLAPTVDALMGKALWPKNQDDGLCDYAVLNAWLQRADMLRQANDPVALISHMRPCFSRSFCRLNEPKLYTECLSCTKTIVNTFYNSLYSHMDWICQHASVPLSEKLLFFRQARRSLGRSALALSGGGSLTMIHSGVCLELLKQKLLPSVISGTSGGSLIASVIALQTEEEMLNFLNDDLSNCKKVRWFRPIHEQILHYFRSGVLMESSEFEHTARAYFGDWTFREAYEKTGRAVSITTTIANRRARTETDSEASSDSELLVLNYLTSPDVIITSAVVATCALPGLMKPVQLLAKDAKGTVHVWRDSGASLSASHHPHESGEDPDREVLFADGSLKADIPRKRLAELFNVTQLVVSQCNPHTIPFLPNQSSTDSLLARLEKYFHLSLKHQLSKLAKMQLVYFFMFFFGLPHVMHVFSPICCTDSCLTCSGQKFLESFCKNIPETLLLLRRSVLRISLARSLIHLGQICTNTFWLANAEFSPTCFEFVSPCSWNKSWMLIVHY